ncbi:MAG: diacylglycerol kinase [Betaproteobacteria bacterium]|nr:diacylglycerol kinase [Betaproteobacteria bacterium]
MSAPPPSAADMKGKRGLTRLWNAARYSIKGIAAAWRSEEAFRQEVLLVMAAAPLGLWLGENGVERALLVGSVLLILIVELLNSALEAIVDKASPEMHELAGRAKDMGSAAVLISLVLAATVWILTLFF